MYEVTATTAKENKLQEISRFFLSTPGDEHLSVVQ